MLQRVKEYISIDSCVDNNKNLSELLSDEFLISLTPYGLPPHKLILKKGAIIAFSKRKLCNGENFRIKDFDEF